MTNKLKQEKAAGKLIQFNILQDVIQKNNRKHLLNNPATLRGQGKILVVLLQQNHIPQKYLATKLNLTAQSTAEFVQKLEKKGWVTRQKSNKDRRITLVDLTKTGKEQALAITKATIPFLKLLSDGELDQLTHIFTKINDSLSQEIQANDPTWQGRLNTLFASVFEDWFGDD
ncbi:MAG: MarR family transcriptional regulator [Lentilactobacillus hilgardii]|uniref:MarR family winged helix-turn-helix transcriptional regulator n=1 Tax=Lactobacillaceae TaxID=33958 RepID=UPI0010B6C33D|nr:hypothetical protein OAL24_01463 [Oenococcus sicerae]